MIRFESSIPIAFNYVDINQNNDLFVAASIYNVSTGTPVFVSKVPMDLLQNGYYCGDYEALFSENYLVISLVYTDGTYDTIDTNYAPSAECFKETNAIQTFGFFNYGVYSQDETLFVAGNIYDCSSGMGVFVSQEPMDHVLAGVYFGSFTGTLNRVYQVAKFVYQADTFITVDSNYAAGSDTFQLFTPLTGEEIVLFESAQLVGQSTSTSGESEMIQFTQGDTATIQLIATDAVGNRIDLTGAIFETFFRGPQGTEISFPNDQHTANPDQVIHRGEFTLALTSDDTDSIPFGLYKEIVTQITISTTVIYYHGFNICNVLSPIPIQ